MKERTGVPTYLVERYWPGVTIERLLAALERGQRVIEEMSGEGTLIRDVSCTLIPGEEVVFSVYEGPSAAAVRRFNERAGIPLSRIVEAIAMAGDDVDLQVKYSRGQANIILGPQGGRMDYLRKGLRWQ